SEITTKSGNGLLVKIRSLSLPKTSHSCNNWSTSDRSVRPKLTPPCFATSSYKHWARIRQKLSEVSASPRSCTGRVSPGPAKSTFSRLLELKPPPKGRSRYWRQAPRLGRAPTQSFRRSLLKHLGWISI